MYKFSELADDDIFHIVRYTIQQFGQNQAKRYHDELKRTFELLAISPWNAPLRVQEAFHLLHVAG